MYRSTSNHITAVVPDGSGGARRVVSPTAAALFNGHVPWPSGRWDGATLRALRTRRRVLGACITREARARALARFTLAAARRAARDGRATLVALRRARRSTDLSASLASRDVEGPRPLRGPPSLPV